MAEVLGAWHGRLSRRRLLAGASAASTLLLTAGPGCANQRRPAAQTDGAAKPAGAATPKRGGTLIDARYQVLTGRAMDPHTETPTSNKMRRLWYQGLLGYNLRSYAIEPEVAQRWEQPSKTEYVLHLNPGVNWQNKPPADGRSLTANRRRRRLQPGARRNAPATVRQPGLSGHRRYDPGSRCIYAAGYHEAAGRGVPQETEQ